MAKGYISRYILSHSSSATAYKCYGQCVYVHEYRLVTYQRNIEIDWRKELMVRTFLDDYLFKASMAASVLVWCS